MKTLEQINKLRERAVNKYKNDLKQSSDTWIKNTDGQLKSIIGNVLKNNPDNKDNTDNLIFKYEFKAGTRDCEIVFSKELVDFINVVDGVTQPPIVFSLEPTDDTSTTVDEQTTVEINSAEQPKLISLWEIHSDSLGLKLLFAYSESEAKELLRSHYALPDLQFSYIKEIVITGEPTILNL